MAPSTASCLSPTVGETPTPVCVATAALARLGRDLELSAQRSRKPAIIFVRSSSVASSMNSSSLCARLPRGPGRRASGRAGRGVVAVGAAAGLDGASPPRRGRGRRPHDREQPRGAGQRRAARAGSSPRPRSAPSCRARARWRRSRAWRAIAASASSRLHARRSISATARSATTLGRSPPRSRPTLTVVPGRRSSVSAWSAATFWARSQIALAPSSGCRPACAPCPSPPAGTRPGALARHHVLPARARRLQDADAVGAPGLRR